MIHRDNVKKVIHMPLLWDLMREFCLVTNNNVLGKLLTIYFGEDCDSLCCFHYAIYSVLINLIQTFVLPIKLDPGCVVVQLFSINMLSSL